MSQNQNFFTRWSLRYLSAPANPWVLLTSAVLMALLGCGFWLITHPLVLDETAQAAQVLSGVVKYPAGHPNGDYFHRAWSAAHELSGWFLRLVPDISVLSYVRNGLCLFLSLLVPCLGASLLSGRPVFGFLAGVLTLSLAHERFYGVYPIYVYPTYYSNGHIGFHGAILALLLYLGGFRRLGAFLIGIMPGLHVVLAMIPWLVFGLSHVRAIHRPPRSVRSWFLSGVVLAAVPMCVQYLRARGLDSAIDLYLQDGQSSTIAANFTEVSDIHRILRKPLISLEYGVLFCLSGGVLFCVRPPRVLSTFGGPGLNLRPGLLLVWFLCGLLVGIPWMLRDSGWTWPQPLELLMPMRLSNYLVFLIVPLLIGAIGTRYGSLFGFTRSYLLFILAALTLGLFFVLEGTHRGLAVLFLAGVLWALQFREPRSLVRILSLIPVLGVLVGLWVDSGSRVVVAFLAGAFSLLPLALVPLTWRFARARKLESGTLVLVLLLWGGLAVREIRNQESARSDVVSSGTEDVSRWLRKNTSPNDMLLAPMFTRSRWQLTTGHPSLLDADTLWMMSYRPELASGIRRLVVDVYGVDYADRAQILNMRDHSGWLAPHHSPFREGWRSHSRDQWKVISEKYGIQWIITPVEYPLDLPESHRNGEFVVYNPSLL